MINQLGKTVAKKSEFSDQLGTLVIDVQVQRDPTMTVSRMRSMHRFNLLFERVVLDRLFALAIDVLALDTQSFSADRLNPGTAR